MVPNNQAPTMEPMDGMTCVGGTCIDACTTQALITACTQAAKDVAAKLFPPEDAALIVDLIKRDLPYYDATISPDFVEGMNGFARDVGILTGRPAYTDVVAEQFRDAWKT